MVVSAPSEVAAVPLTSSRAMRLAVTRAADRALGLSLTVESVSEDTQKLDGVIGQLATDDSYFQLDGADGLRGIIGLDMQLRAAAIEMQTMGSIGKKEAAARPHTGTDMLLATPLCAAVLEALPKATQGSDLDGWAAAIKLGDPFETLRAAGLMLPDARYKIMTITVDLNGEGRQGHLVIVLPTCDAVEVLDAPDVDAQWDRRMHTAVSSAPAAMDAILHKLRLPLGQVNDLAVGDVLPLHGVTVGSVKLFAPKDTLVGTARLGQSGGMRAVRLETPPEPHMRDIPAPVPAEVKTMA